MSPDTVRSLPLRLLVAFVAAPLAVSGCARTVGPAVEDAQLLVRVKTAIVNDPVLGPRAIGVEASRGVIHLTGSVRSEAEIEQAIALARSVEGVRDVTWALAIAASDPARPATRRYRPRRTGGAAEAESWPGTIAIGASFGVSRRTGAVGSGVTVGPQLAVRPRRGFGAAIGFGWYRGDLRTSDGRDAFGRLRVRPFMGGVAYTLLRDRLSVTPSLVAGLAFNSLSIDRSLNSDLRAVDVDNSLAARLGVGVGYRLNRRVSLTGFAGRLFVRPDVTFVDPGGIFTRSLHADATQINVGFVYWLF